MLLADVLIYSFIDVKGFRSNKSSGFNGPFNAIFHGQASKLFGSAPAWPTDRKEPKLSQKNAVHQDKRQN